MDGKELCLLWWLRNSLETFIEAEIKTVSSSPLSAALEHSAFTRRLQLGTPCVRAPGLKESGIPKCQTAYRSVLLKPEEEPGNLHVAIMFVVKQLLIMIHICKLNIVQTTAASFLNLKGFSTPAQYHCGVSQTSSSTSSSTSFTSIPLICEMRETTGDYNMSPLCSLACVGSFKCPSRLPHSSDIKAMLSDKKSSVAGSYIPVSTHKDREKVTQWTVPFFRKPQKLCLVFFPGYLK